MLFIGRRPSTDMKRSGMEIDCMVCVEGLCLWNKVLGNIEKFAANQGLQTFFFKEKVL